MATLLRVAVADLVAYRAQFFIWALTTNMPLIMLGVWNAVVAEAPLGQWGQTRFIQYYLTTMMVRLLVSNWVVWELTMAIRQGTLALRLLRPLHPLAAYSAEQLAAIPLRIVIILPIVFPIAHWADLKAAALFESAIVTARTPVELSWPFWLNGGLVDKLVYIPFEPFHAGIA